MFGLQALGLICLVGFVHPYTLRGYKSGNSKAFFFCLNLVSNTINKKQFRIASFFKIQNYDTF